MVYLLKHLEKICCKKFVNENRTYRKVASSNFSGLEAHADFFRLLMKGIFDP